MKKERFFLKKRTKNLCRLGHVLPETARDSIKKFFASFFQKRSACLSSRF
jgi:hypothetical protein